MTKLSISFETLRFLKVDPIDFKDFRWLYIQLSRQKNLPPEIIYLIKEEVYFLVKGNIQGAKFSFKDYLFIESNLFCFEELLDNKTYLEKQIRMYPREKKTFLSEIMKIESKRVYLFNNWKRLSSLFFFELGSQIPIEERVELRRKYNLWACEHKEEWKDYNETIFVMVGLVLLKLILKISKKAWKSISSKFEENIDGP